MPDHPTIEDAPGLQWPRRADGWVATWVARRDIIDRGFRPKTQRLFPRSGEAWRWPVDEDVAYIQSECQRLQDDMLAWARGNGGLSVVPFTGTWKSLIDCYRSDEDSPYQELRPASRRSYNSHLDMIEAQIGERAVHATRGRDFKRWFAAWSVDPDGSRHIPRAHDRMVMLRIVLIFGVTILEEAQCLRLRTILDSMQFEQGKARTVALSADQAVAVREAAHTMGLPAIALAQAIQFELMLRQKDVIGEWVPNGEPGLSLVTEAGRKWLNGIDWREISPELVLTHRLSKSLRGRGAVLDHDAGKVKTFDLKLYPMVMEELRRIPAEQCIGPVVKDPDTGLPYRESTYRHHWRRAARAAGVPENVQNRDSRAGGITEGIRVTKGNVAAVRHAAGHSKIETTLIYAREADQQTAEVAVLRGARTDGKRP